MTKAKPVAEHKRAVVSKIMVDKEKLPMALDALAEPLARMKTVARELGLSPVTMNNLVRRIKSKYQPVLDEVKNVKNEEFISLLENKARMALIFLDELDMANASAKDKALVAAILLDKRQMLKGEPMLTISIEERSSLNELIPALKKEMERRAMTIDVVADDVQIFPGDSLRTSLASPNKVDQLDKIERRAKDEIGEP
jgi:hypothetical protein